MDRKPLEKMKAVAKYDPSKSYEWAPEDLFTVSGLEIDAWNKALAVMAATPEFQRFLQVQRGAVLMQEFIKDSVEQDLIRERKEESKIQQELEIIKVEDGPIEPII